MKKVLFSVAAIAAAALMYVSPAAAAYAAQIEQGDIYWARTNSGPFVDPTNATCGDTVQFRVRIHNLGPDVAENVNVKATLPNTVATSHSSKVTIAPSNGQPASISDTAGVTLDKAAKLNYINGSTELLDANGAKLQTLGDSIFTSGINIDKIGISTQQKRFVQFSVKTDCPTPEAKKIKVCELDSKKIITIDEKNFDSKKHSKTLADCAETPKPGEITVCEVESGKVVTIKENQFDSKKHTKDLSKCAEKEVPVVTELPRTGANGMIVGTVLSALVAGAAYALQRRNTLG